MKHLGDITKINGAEIEIVDVITGGSPCQDLSIAGKRAGLAGARSGLFMEQVRIVKEMRGHDRKSGRTGDMVRPRYMVLENVPGAFSSNKGKDFAAVLEEIARIAEPGFSLSGLPEKWKWTKAGAIDGATGWKKFKNLTFPLIIPFFSINMVLSVKNFLMVFDQIMALTKGGPAQSTESISYLIYNNGMSGGQFGFQSANAVIFFIVIVVISVAQMTITGKKEEQL